MIKSKLELGKINGDIYVLIEKKDIKNVHLKVFRDLSVKLSVPNKVPDDWIISFLEKKKEWINKQIFKYKQSSGSNNMVYLKNGCSIQMLGKDFRIYIKSGKKKIVKEEKKLIIYLDDVSDLETAAKIFDDWWKKESKILYEVKVKEFYNSIFKKYKINLPTIQIRKMKTMWGNCCPQKSLITLNNYLFKANALGIEYVIMHEMTHLLYPKHNENFYSFMTIHMPDWKERKQILDLDVVQGV